MIRVLHRETGEPIYWGSWPPAAIIAAKRADADPYIIYGTGGERVPVEVAELLATRKHHDCDRGYLGLSDRR